MLLLDSLSMMLGMFSNVFSLCFCHLKNAIYFLEYILQDFIVDVCKPINMYT